MTAAVIVLTVLAAGLAAAFIAAVYRFVDSYKEWKNAERRIDMLTLQVAGLSDSIEAKRDAIARLERVLAATKLERDRFAGAAIVGLGDADVRSIINGDVDGLLPFPGAAYRGPDTGIDGAGSVPVGPAPAEPG